MGACRLIGDIIGGIYNEIQQTVITVCNKSLETMFGKVELERIGYGSRSVSNIFPQDEKLEMLGRLYSYPLQERACREAVRSSYDEINETLGKYTGAHVPRRQRLNIVSRDSENFEAF